MEKRKLQKTEASRRLNKRLYQLGLIAVLLATTLACNIGLIPSKIQQAPTVLPGSGCAPVDVFGEGGANVDGSCQEKQDKLEQWLTDWSDPKPTSLPGPTSTPNCNPLPAQTAVIGKGYIVPPEQSQKEQRAQETRYPGQCKGGKFIATATPARSR